MSHEQPPAPAPALPCTIRTQGLPRLGGGRLAPGQAFEFWLGYADHVIGEDRVVLRIPEMPQRAAEGRPAHPEQARWVEQAIADHGLRLKGFWYSHWVFEDDASLARFVELLGQ